MRRPDLNHNHGLRPWLCSSGVVYSTIELALLYKMDNPNCNILRFDVLWSRTRVKSVTLVKLEKSTWMDMECLQVRGTREFTICRNNWGFILTVNAIRNAVTKSEQTNLSRLMLMPCCLNDKCEQRLWAK